MNPRGYEGPSYKLANAWIGIHLGFQPSAAPSSRRGGEVEEDGLVLTRCLGEHGVDILLPSNRFRGHVVLSD
jgi:hypothetical protein